LCHSKAEGKKFDEVMKARPTATYDVQWGKEASWTTNDFVPVVFHQLGGGVHFDLPQ